MALSVLLYLFFTTSGFLPDLSSFLAEECIFQVILSIFRPVLDNFGQISLNIFDFVRW